MRIISSMRFPYFAFWFLIFCVYSCAKSITYLLAMFSWFFFFSFFFLYYCYSVSSLLLYFVCCAIRDNVQNEFYHLPANVFIYISVWESFNVRFDSLCYCIKTPLNRFICIKNCRPRQRQRRCAFCVSVFYSLKR